MAVAVASIPNSGSQRASALLRSLKRLAPSHIVHGIMRRKGWFTENASAGKLFNSARNAAGYALKSQTAGAYPMALKIDISPECNLRCTVCIHAEAHGRTRLEQQEFNKRQRMTVARFRRIIDEVAGKTSAVSLYYMGDPLVHPDLDKMCRIARDAGLNVHVSTNFSFRLSDERIRSIVESGVTHFTACVDGLSQEKYELTRVGGNIDRVLDNLRRLVRTRDELGLKYPKIEVQYVKFQHNADELEAAKKLTAEMGVDAFSDFWGRLTNCTDSDAGTFEIFAPKQAKRLPQCLFPHTTLVIKHNGDVIPCCCYRQGDQYRSTGESRTVGNVFETSVREVWNAPGMRAARRLSGDPTASDKDATLKDHFCYGCPSLYKTDLAERIRRGDEALIHDVVPKGRDRSRRRAAARTNLDDGTIRSLPVLAAGGGCCSAAAVMN